MSEHEQYLGKLTVSSAAISCMVRSLCKLLTILAKHALDHPGVPIKEFQIATEVFGLAGL